MTNNEFILARNSGTPPVKLLLDKSLSLTKKYIQRVVINEVKKNRLFM